MANTVIGTLATTDTTYVLPKASANLTVDVLEGPSIYNLLKSKGVINYDETLSKEAGDTVNFYNLNRIDSVGSRGQIDHYENSASREYGQRSVVIDQISYDEYYFQRGVITQQRAPFNLSEGRLETIAAWNSSMIDCGLLNQACGNTATSISQPDVASIPFTGDYLTNITLLNSPIAPTASYKATGSATDVADDSITSSHLLTMQDAMIAQAVVMQSYSGVPKWNRLMGKGGLWGIWLMSVTGFNQLMNQAQAAGANHTLSNLFYALIQGGKEGMKWGDFPTIPLPNGLMICVVPDNYLPRGVASSAAVANTRSSVILGAGAIDFAVGAGYQTTGGDRRIGFMVRQDPNHKKLNDQTFLQTIGIFGGKKRQQNGFGANAATAYDMATYVINHYSAI